MCAHIEPVHGAPCWVSLTTNGLDRAQQFYGKVLGWTFRPGSLGDDFTVAHDGDGVPVAGLGAIAGALNIPVAWTPYFSVPDVDTAASRIAERAATVAVGPLRLGGGRALMAADPHGARFGLWQGPVLPSWHAEKQAPPGRLDLRTRDAFAAAIFYGEVLDWGQGTGSCDVTFAADTAGTVEVRASGHLAATMSGGAVETAPDPRVRPRWNVSFYAADPDAAASAAEAAGGRALTEPAPADGHAVTLCDPDGALFTVRHRKQ